MQRGNVFNNEKFAGLDIGCFLKYYRLRHIITQSNTPSISVFLFIYGSGGNGN